MPRTKDTAQESAFTPEQMAYREAAEGLVEDTAGSDWGSLLGFLAGAGAAVATGGAALPAIFAAGVAGSSAGEGIGGLLNEEEGALKKTMKGATQVTDVHKKYWGDK